MDKTVHYRSTCIRYGKYFILIITLTFILSFSKDNNETRILFVGDILLSRNIKEELSFNKDLPWSNLKSLFNSSDLVIGNLEGAVGDKKHAYNSPIESPVFDIDSLDISKLKEAGFNFLSVENNHSLDLGEKGKNKTIKILRENSLTPIYFDNSPQFITIKNLVISIIALNDIICRDSSKNSIPSIEVEQKIRMARNLSNIVIITIHWGSELLDWPNKRQREIADWLIKKGADIIIGSHPHVIQKPELVRGKPVFFSLGNHLFDQKYPSTKEGLIVDIRIQNGKFACTGYLTHTKQRSFYPEVTDSINFNFKSFDYKDTLLHLNNFILKPLSLVEENKNRIVLQAFQDGKFAWKSFPLPLVSVCSCKLDGKNEYLFALQEHYSSIDSEVNVRPYVYALDKFGLVPRWRGSALAWPLIDAQISPFDNKTLFALHRGDSFINLDKRKVTNRIAVYKWNGFGFNGVSDSTLNNLCSKQYNDYRK
jgi:hypothetical protein